MKTVTIRPLLDKHVSQLAGGATTFRLDCGPACVSMILLGYTGKSPTVDAIFQQATHGSIDKCVTIQELQAVLGTYLVSTTQAVRCSEADLYRVLMGKRPPIALINYGTLRKYVTTYDKKWSGGHFVVVIGMTHDTVVYLDPLFPDDTLQPKEVSLEGWMDAWNDAVLNGNTAGQMVVPTSPIGQLSPPVDTSVLYRVLVTCSVLNIRSKPVVASGNVIGYARNTDLPRDVYEERVISSKQKWLAISPDRYAWIAAMYGGVSYTKKV